MKTIILLNIISIALFVLLASICFVGNTSVSKQNVPHEAQQKLLTYPSPQSHDLTHEVQPMRCTEPERVIGSTNHARESVPEGESSINSHTTRRLWFDEGKVAKEEPSFDWRTTRRLWYVE